MGGLNIDTADKTKDKCNYLSDLCDTFSVTNIIRLQSINCLVCVSFALKNAEGGQAGGSKKDQIF